MNERGDEQTLYDNRTAVLGVESRQPEVEPRPRGEDNVAGADKEPLCGDRRGRLGRTDTRGAVCLQIDANDVGQVLDSGEPEASDRAVDHPIDDSLEGVTPDSVHPDGEPLDGLLDGSDDHKKERDESESSECSEHRREDRVHDTGEPREQQREQERHRQGDERFASGRVAVPEIARHGEGRQDRRHRKHTQKRLLENDERHHTSLQEKQEQRDRDQPDGATSPEGITHRDRERVESRSDLPGGDIVEVDLPGERRPDRVTVERRRVDRRGPTVETPPGQSATSWSSPVSPARPSFRALLASPWPVCGQLHPVIG